MLLKILTYFLLAIYSANCATPGNSSLEGITCREEFSFGYNYRFFHKISDITTNRTEGFRLDFKVRTGSNAHISLSENAYPSPREVVYEVVLGAGRNTYSDIRRGRGSASKAKETTLNIVSATEVRGFWIYIHNDGRIMVGKDGDDLPFLMWKDPIPIRINYYSFSTWKDVYGKWYYNCAKKQEEPEEKDEVTRPMTMTEKLRLELLTGYDPFIAPRSESKRTTVHAHLFSNHVHLDEKRSVLQVHGTMSLSWVDEKLQWSPSDYGNLSSIVLGVFEAWIPDIMLYNSAGEPSESYNSGLVGVGLIVSSGGTVFWAPQAHYEAFCEELDLSNWPNDIQTCELHLGFWSQQHLLQLELMGKGTHNEPQITGTEWEIINMTAEMAWVRTPWDGMNDPLMEDGNDLVDPIATNEFHELEIVVHSSLAVKFTLLRRNKGYNAVLLVPLAMVLIFNLLSFWASPFGSSKLALQCLSIITTIIFLLTTWKVLPAHAIHIPSIILAYKISMVMACISMISTVVIINFTRYAPLKHFSPLLSQFLKSEWMSYIFCLPTNDEQVSKRYNTLDDTQQLSDDFSEKSPVSSDYELQWNWILLSAFMDRIMFFIHCILFVYIFSSFI